MFADEIHLTHEDAGADEPAAAPQPGGDLDLRQLRHHTKNALQRISGLVATAPGLRTMAVGRQLAAEIERRIHLAVRVSDALFGLTRAPGSLEQRLRTLAEDLAELLADPDQVVRVEVTCAGVCPAALHGVVLRATQELVGNAVKHGLRARLAGRVRVDLASGPWGTALVVADDGWGHAAGSGCGQGVGLVRALVAPLGGTLALRSGSGGGTTAEVVLPPTMPDGQVVTLAGP